MNDQSHPHTEEQSDSIGMPSDKIPAAIIQGHNLPASTKQIRGSMI
jgi:hypothetical protein